MLRIENKVDQSTVQRDLSKLCQEKDSYQKKKLNPDPVYNSLSVSKFTNMIMLDGKKRVAEKILYSALEILAKNSKEDPITMMDKALQNVSPSVEVKSRRVGGSNYQVPVEAVSYTHLTLPTNREV